jgi:putrescine transport system substrate-binding protein
MRAALTALCLLLAAPAGAAPVDPFLPAPAPAATVIKVLAPSDFIDRAVLEAFEAANHAAVALDAYADADELAARSAEQRYDVMILRGPALSRRLAAGALARLDRKRLPNARLVQPAVVSRYAAYDREDAYGVPFGWSAFGLLYDADKPAPVSWRQALGLARERPPDCALVWPNAREETFLAIWRVLGIDPARARPAEVKAAALALEKARGGFLAFAAPDEVGAFVKGAACWGAGTAGEAAAALVRGGDNPRNVGFVYPREGAPLALYAFAIPADAPSPDAAYRLIDALLEPDNARRDAADAGLTDAEAPVEAEVWRRLAPEPVFDAATAAAVQAEWRRLTSAK